MIKRVELNRWRGGLCAQAGSALLSCAVLALNGMEVNPPSWGTVPASKKFFGFVALTVCVKNRVMLTACNLR